MAKQRFSANKWQPIIFNANRLANERQEQEWLAGLLERGKIVVSPSEIGLVAWARADRNLKSKVSLLSDAISPNVWVIGVSERSAAQKWWAEGVWSEALERTLKVFWPGPLFVQAVAKEGGAVDLGGVWSRKIPLWMPYSGLSSTLLKICEFPLAAGQFRWEKGLFPPARERIIDSVGSHLEIVLEGRERPGRRVPSLLDVSCHDWRMVQRGGVSAKQLSEISSRPILLSCEAKDAFIGVRSNIVRLIVFEGESERVVRRMRAFVEGLESGVSVHYYLHSDCAQSAFAGEPHIHRPLGERKAEEITSALEWQKLALETWDSICSINEPQEAVALLEGVPRNECTEEFMERLSRSAYHVINMMSMDD